MEGKIEGSQLIHFNKARQEIALAKSIDEVKNIRDKAEAIRHYIRQQGASLEMLNQCAEIKLRAEIRAGEMLAENPDIHPGGEPKLHDVTLEQFGITKIQSHRWQREFNIGENTLDQFLTATAANKEEATTIGFIRFGAKLNAPSEAEWLPLPEGKYRTIIVDPPWPIQKIIRDVTPQQYHIDYGTKTIDEIALLDIPSIMANDGIHLYLWATQKHLPDAVEVLNGWGIKYIFTMVWHKRGGFQPFNLPQYNCEFILFGRTGGLEFNTTKEFFTCFEGQRREHSRKPIEFYDIVRRVSPEPRLDMFSREKQEGFEQYGLEIGKFNAQGNNDG